jgi:dolichol-phosphate mannosyltransferase
MKLSIIAPCYNEAENVPKLHDELLPVVEGMLANKWNNGSGELESVEIIFVDDGSRDNTYERLTEAFGTSDNARVVHKIVKHETNLGLGAAIRTGFKNGDGDILMTIDSDGTYRFSEIPALLAMLKPKVAIVTASPYHPRGGVVGVPAYRLLLSKGSSFIYRILVDWHVYTYTSLFRAYRADIAKNIEFESNDFRAGTEILVKAILAGYRAVEYPTVLHKRMYGVSKAKIVQTILSHLRFQGWVLLYKIKSLFGLNPEQKK